MFISWHQFIVGITSLPVAATLFVLCVLCMTGFKWRERKLRGVITPDSLMRGSTAARVHASLAQLGAAGRKLYLWSELTLDLLFPAVYAAFFAVACQWLLQHHQTWLAALPLLAAIADYGENFSAAFLAATFREESPSPLAWFTAVATNIKFVFFFASIGATGCCGVIWLWRLPT